MIRRVTSGQDFQIPASAYNAMATAADAEARRQIQDSTRTTPTQRWARTVLMQNNSGAQRQRYDVLGIAAPLVLPATNLDEFHDLIALSGVAPTDQHTGRFAILLEALPVGEIGRAIVSGPVQVQIEMQTADDDFAGPAEAVTDHLVSTGATGQARILWVDEPASYPGTAWGVVNLRDGAGAGGPMPVIITASSGTSWPAVYSARRFEAGALPTGGVGPTLPLLNYAELLYDGTDFPKAFQRFPVGQILSGWHEDVATPGQPAAPAPPRFGAHAPYLKNARRCPEEVPP